MNPTGVKALFFIVLSAVLLSGCASSTTAPPPRPLPPKVEYSKQEKLLHEAMGRVESASDKSDPETLRLLKQLEEELAHSKEAYVASQRRIAELEAEVKDLQQAAGFSVHRVEIQFFTHADEKGIELGVTPYDRHGDVVKTAGDFEVSLHRSEFMRKLGRTMLIWRFTAREMESSWEGGLYPGYRMKLTWPEGKIPEEPKGVLQVRFTTPEGKSFTDSKEITIGENTP